MGTNIKGFSTLKDNILCSSDCDVALIGFPNAGKTSLFCALTGQLYSNKILRYAPITINDISFLLADIGGITPKSKPEKNPGALWLKFISKAKVLLFVIRPDKDIQQKQLTFLRSVVEYHNNILSTRRYIVVLNCTDEVKNIMNWYPEETVVSVNAINGMGLSELTHAIWENISKEILWRI